MPGPTLLAKYLELQQVATGLSEVPERQKTPQIGEFL